MKKIITLLLALVCVAGHAQGLVPINAEAESLIHQGHALQTQGKYKDAFEKFSAAAQADPQASLPLSSIAGMLLSMAKQTQEAGALSCVNRRKTWPARRCKSTPTIRWPVTSVPPRSTPTIRRPGSTPAIARQPDAGLWLSLAMQQAIEGKAGASPFAIELAAWRKFIDAYQLRP